MFSTPENENERQIMSKSENKFIIQYIDFFFEDVLQGIVMEYCEVNNYYFKLLVLGIKLKF